MFLRAIKSTTLAMGGIDGMADIVCMASRAVDARRDRCAPAPTENRAISKLRQKGRHGDSAAVEGRAAVPGREVRRLVPDERLAQNLPGGRSAGDACDVVRSFRTCYALPNEDLSTAVGVLA